MFSVPATPAPLPAAALGAYGKGCVAGAQRLDSEGPGWQVMRLSRGRYFGHPKLVAWIQQLAGGVRQDGLPDLLVGDMAQPRGGPMLTGHDSHQLGLEADIYLTPAPAERLLSMDERENMDAIDMVQTELLDVNADFTAAQLDLLRPWSGHTYHFHVALECPNAGCANRFPVPPGEGCGRELDPWFRKEVRSPKPTPVRQPRILTLNELPRACRTVLAAP